jgi:Lipopolysaccharide-assembly
MKKLQCFAALLLTNCGYHVASTTIPVVAAPAGQPAAKSDSVPVTIKTIAIPAFANATVRYKLARLLPAGIAQEFISRTKYNIVADPNQADAVLKGSLANFVVFQVISDPVTGRATGAEIVVTIQVTLTERATGKVLFTRPSLEFRERYEISTDPQTYFDESGTAIERVARDAARTVVSAILENF